MGVLLSSERLGGAFFSLGGPLDLKEPALRLNLVRFFFVCCCLELGSLFVGVLDAKLLLGLSGWILFFSISAWMALLSVTSWL